MDKCIYHWRSKEGKIACIISTHVDDLKGAGEPQVLDTILRELSKRFGKLEKVVGSFEYCGLQHTQDSKTKEIKVS